MNYSDWVSTHGQKHQTIMSRLTHLSDSEVIEYFRFENMVKNEPNFCPLYSKNKKCHDIEILNCYLCACPNFRFDDKGLYKKDGKTVFSKCSINSKDGSTFESDDSVHQDCSECIVPHDERNIKSIFSRDWIDIVIKKSQFIPKY